MMLPSGPRGTGILFEGVGTEAGVRTDHDAIERASHSAIPAEIGNRGPVPLPRALALRESHSSAPLELASQTVDGLCDPHCRRHVDAC